MPQSNTKHLSSSDPGGLPPDQPVDSRPAIDFSTLPPDWPKRIPRLLSTGLSVLRNYRFEGRRFFTEGDAKDAVGDFFAQPEAKIRLFQIAEPAELPEIRKNELFLARLPTGLLHIRISNLRGVIRFDETLCDSSESRALAQRLHPLWRRSRFNAQEKDGILRSVQDLTRQPFPGNYAIVISSQKPWYSETKRENYVLVSFRNYAHKWAQRRMKLAADSLDAPVGAIGSGLTGHDVIPDEFGDPADQALMKSQKRELIQRTLNDLPGHLRATVKLFEERVQGGATDPSLQTVAGRKRLQGAKHGFRAVFTLHRTIETATGRGLIRFLAPGLIEDEKDRELIICHFGNGEPLPSESSSEPGEADRIRRAVLRGAIALYPYLSHRRKLVFSLLPQTQRPRVEALLAGANRVEMTALLGCSWKDLDDHVRRIQGDLAMMWDAVSKQSSAVGRTSLKTKIEEILSGDELEVSIAIWLHGSTPHQIASELEMTEEEVRRTLFSGLLNIYGRRFSAP